MSRTRAPRTRKSCRHACRSKSIASFAKSILYTRKQNKFLDMKRGLSIKLWLLVLVLPFLGLSCNNQNAGDFLQSQLVDKLKAQWQGAQSWIQNIVAETGKNFVNNLSDTDKKAIEEWLIKNKLNQYGDAKATVYTGGTPLFDEQTGKSLNRYEYLFEKFPELKDIVKSVTEKTQ
jgi:hypothetical protein